MTRPELGCNDRPLLRHPRITMGLLIWLYGGANAAPQASSRRSRFRDLVRPRTAALVALTAVAWLECIFLRARTDAFCLLVVAALVVRLTHAGANFRGSTAGPVPLPQLRLRTVARGNVALMPSLYRCASLAFTSNTTTVLIATGTLLFWSAVQRIDEPPSPHQPSMGAAAMVILAVIVPAIGVVTTIVWATSCEKLVRRLIRGVCMECGYTLQTAWPCDTAQLCPECGRVNPAVL